jgi:iron complex transport system substrate-binding protein
VQHRRAAARTLLLLLPGLALACGRDATRPVPPAAGRTPERLVVLAPNLTEIVYALGLGDRVVGVGNYGDFPPEVSDKPRLGGLLDPHLEAIVELAPDLVVLMPSQQELADRLAGLGIDALVVESEDTIEDILAAVRRIAGRCGVADAGAALTRRLRRQLAPRPLPGSPRVLVTVGRPQGSLGGLTAAGADTFYDQLLQRLGAVNVAAASRMRYPQLNLEVVVRAAPDVIIELQGTGLSARGRYGLPGDWKPLDTLPAVRHGCVTVVEGDFAFVPGPRLPQIYEALREAIESCAAVSSASGGEAVLLP